MARDFLQVAARIQGERDVQAALRRLPADGQEALREGSRKIARVMATAARAAGRADSRQSARAASTVRVLLDTSPKVTAGPHPMLFGSEFGIKRRTGWYAARRYADSPARQYRPHQGAASYWFFSSLAESQPAANREYAAMAREVVDRFGRG